MNSQKEPQPDTQSRFLIVRLLRRWPALSMIEFFLFGVLAVCGLLFLFWLWSRVIMDFFLHWWENDVSRLQYAGQFGDLFGSLNVVIGICTIGGLIYTIHLQRVEISKAENEARLSRADAHSAKFTDTTFQLIALLRDQAHSVASGSGKMGPAAWREMFLQLSNGLKNNDSLSTVWAHEIQGISATSFKCYFDTLLRAVEYIDAHGQSDKELFFGLIRDQTPLELRVVLLSASTAKAADCRKTLVKCKLSSELNVNNSVVEAAKEECPDLFPKAPGLSK